ncbi:hypothetical protein H8D85_01480 [bacterium]|nr:hypothetical protein [bacterium]
MGEMFALRAMSGVGLSTGAGKGWASSDESSASEVFSISAGKILDQSHYRMRAKKDLYDYTHNISVTGGSEINFTAGTFTYSLTFDAAGTATLSSGAAKIELSATGANIIPIVGTGLTVGNTPVPVTGFCSLPVCLFTGAPHTTNVHSTI